MRISRIYRLLRLITLLQSGRKYTADELAQELEVSRRTIFRDLNMLEMAHIPYYFDAEHGGYQINRHFFLPPVNLTLGEALAMLVLSGGLRGAGKLPLLSEGTRAAVKLESVLPAAIREHVGSVIDNVSMTLGPLSRHEQLGGMFEQLAGAIVRQCVCELVYLSFRERKQITVTVHPLRLVFRSRAWYLIAFSETHKQVRTFKLGRIRKLTVSDKTFTPPKGVDLESHFGRAWGMIPEGRLYDVRLHFDSKVAGNVAEVQWHPTQQVEWNDDGSIEFCARVDGLGEITWWILGYGDQVEVLEPPALRKRFVEVAGAMLGRHSREAE